MTKNKSRTQSHRAKPSQLNTKGLLEEIQRIRASIVAARDRLRVIQDDLSELVESSDEATDELATAIETLSKYL